MLQNRQIQGQHRLLVLQNRHIGGQQRLLQNRHIQAPGTTQAAKEQTHPGTTQAATEQTHPGTTQATIEQTHPGKTQAAIELQTHPGTTQAEIQQNRHIQGQHRLLQYRPIQGKHKLLQNRHIQGQQRLLQNRHSQGQHRVPQNRHVKDSADCCSTGSQMKDTLEQRLQQNRYAQGQHIQAAVEQISPVTAKDAVEKVRPEVAQAHPEAGQADVGQSRPQTMVAHSYKEDTKQSSLVLLIQIQRLTMTLVGRKIPSLYISLSSFPIISNSLSVSMQYLSIEYRMYEYILCCFIPRTQHIVNSCVRSFMCACTVQCPGGSNFRLHNKFYCGQSGRGERISFTNPMTRGGGGGLRLECGK